jgi:hypothetical protein
MQLRRQPRHVLSYGIPIAVVLAGSILIVWLGNRAAAVVSFITVIVALTLTYESTNAARRQAERSEEQVRHSAQQVATAHFQAHLAALATAYAYHPVLIPLHDAAPPVDVAAEKYYPAMGAYKPPPPETAERVFLIDEGIGAASVYLRNVGSGPAVAIEVRLDDSSGQERILAGAAAIGAGAEERFTIQCDSLERRERGPKSGPAPWVRSVGEQLAPGVLADRKAVSRAYRLSIRYRGLGPMSSVIEMDAVFDPRGTGRWCLDLDHSFPDANVLTAE